LHHSSYPSNHPFTFFNFLAYRVTTKPCVHVFQNSNFCGFRPHLSLGYFPLPWGYSTPPWGYSPPIPCFLVRFLGLLSVFRVCFAFVVLSYVNSKKFSFFIKPPLCPATQFKSVFYCATIGGKAFLYGKRPNKSIAFEEKVQQPSPLLHAGFNASMAEILVWGPGLVQDDRQDWMTGVLSFKAERVLLRPDPQSCTSVTEGRGQSCSLF
jgi:hypothetical protein